MSEGLQTFAVSAVREARTSIVSEVRATARHARSRREEAARAERREIARLAAERKRLAADIAVLEAEAAAMRGGPLFFIDAFLRRDTGFSLDDLRLPGRKRPVAHTRQLAMWLARQMTAMSLPAIARRWNRSDHTTALHACRAVTAWEGEEAAWRDDLLAELRERLPAA